MQIFQYEFYLLQIWYNLGEIKYVVTYKIGKYIQHM